MEFGDDEGMNVTLEGATEILKFLAKMANITVRKFLSENKKIYNHGGIIMPLQKILISRI